MSLPRLIRIILSLLIAASLLSCSREPRLPATRLVVFISVDQFWYPYLQRYGQHFTGGLKTLLQSGALFTNARINYAITETGPGHATMVSGAYPSTHGIVANHWYDVTEQAERYCVDDSYYGLSSRAMRVPALPDWIKGEFDSSRAFAVSGKDRSAILMAGRKADGAFWFSRDTGTFATSSFYNLITTDWLVGGQEGVSADSYFGQLWAPLAITETSYGTSGMASLARGELEPDFPYPLGSISYWPDEEFYSAVYRSPFMDELTWEFARDLILREQLGTREDSIDYLALSFSALDTVGHTFGPESKEAADVLFRLDAILEKLFVLLEEKIGLDKTVVILTSDHGIQPYPELEHVSSGRQSRRMHGVDIACVQQAAQRINTKLGTVSIWKSHLVLDREVLRAHRLSKTIVDAVVRESLEECAAVERVWTRDELRFGTGADAIGKLYKRNISKGRGPDYYLQHPEGFLNSWPSGTNHGSPYDYDRHVPVFILANKVAPARIEEAIGLVDIAPTVASLLNVSIPRFVEGESKSKLLFKEP